MTDYADLIKQTLTMEQVLKRYGIKTTNHGRTACPLHKGTGKNFSYKGRSFKCWVCGAHGTVIDFVMQYFNITFPEALVRLNEDFALGFPIGKHDPTPEQTEKIRLAEETRRKRIAHEKTLKQLCTAYNSALDWYTTLDIIVQHDAPKGPYDEITPQYEYALKHIDAAWDDVQFAAGQIRKFNEKEGD